MMEEGRRVEGRAHLYVCKQVGVFSGTSRLIQQPIKRAERTDVDLNHLLPLPP